MYEILDHDNVLVAEAEDVHEADRAWDVLTKTDEELLKTWDSDFLSKYVSKYRPEGFVPGSRWLKVVQIHRTFKPAETHQ